MELKELEAERVEKLAAVRVGELGPGRVGKWGVGWVLVRAPCKQFPRIELSGPLSSQIRLCRRMGFPEMCGYTARWSLSWCDNRLRWYLCIVTWCVLRSCDGRIRFVRYTEYIATLVLPLDAVLV